MLKSGKYQSKIANKPLANPNPNQDLYSFVAKCIKIQNENNSAQFSSDTQRG